MALGTILQQEQDGQLRVIGYASRTLTNAERLYCIMRKELLGVVYGQHLLGRHIVICTDHAALTFLMKTPEPVGQHGRWFDLLSEYHIDINTVQVASIVIATHFLDALANAAEERTASNACGDAGDRTSPTVEQTTAITAELVLGGVI